MCQLLKGYKKTFWQRHTTQDIAINLRKLRRVQAAATIDTVSV
jgi:hypothetical protein